MTVTILNIESIVSDPHIRQGRPILVGTTIEVQDLVASHVYRGFSAEELAVEYRLPLGQVHAALAYYYMHKAEIEALMRHRADESERLMAELEAKGKLKRFE